MAARQRRFIFHSSAAFIPVLREDVYDAEHIFPQLEIILDYLANFRAYHEENIPVDGGALLCGPPGIGKTLFARYIASLSGARFINAREFPVEIRNGLQIWQPKDVTALFRLSDELVKAHNKSVVIFFDQFDDFLAAVSSAVKNQFELELDGFLQRGAGIFLLVTSQSMPKVVVEPLSDDDDDGDKLMSPFGGALFRRGRIGIHIPFSRPDFTQSAKLLRGFLGEHPHADGIDCDSLVHILSSPTAADIKYGVSEARQLARREAVKAGAEKEAISKAQITQAHLIEVFLSKALDKETGHTLTDREKRNICVHELGHFIVGRALGLPMRFVSVRAGLSTLGITFGNDDDKTRSHEDLRWRIACSSGGWEAERLCGIPKNTGKSGDVNNVNDVAEWLVNLGERKHLKKFGFLKVNRNQTEYDGIRMSEKLLLALEKDLVLLQRVGEKRAREIVRFFGKGLIQDIAKVLQADPHGVILRVDLDKLLEPKLSEFHRLHKIVDRIHHAQ